jgi:hypothetical protein
MWRDSTIFNNSENTFKFLIIIILEVNFSFITKFNELIVFFIRILIAAENEVDPLVQIFTHIRTFQSLSHQKNIFFRKLRFHPFRQLNFTHLLIVLGFPEILVIYIFQEFRKIVKLRNYFSVVYNFAYTRFPTLFYIFEQSVSDIEFIFLQIEMSFCERVDSHQVICSCTNCAIVFSIKILSIPGIL